MTSKQDNSDKLPGKEEHYYSKNPSSIEKRKDIEFNFNGSKFVFTTSSGVFSKDKPDLGSVVLLKAVKPVGKVLDFGCGYGLIGIILKKLIPSLVVTCSDINSRAVYLAEENAKNNNVEIKSVQSDIFENLPENYDTIIVNLPQNAGKEICFNMIEQSFSHLNLKGTLQVVSRHQKGGKQFEKKMNEVFGNCEYLSKESGYRVYISKK